MPSNLKQALHTAHAALEYAIINDIGIYEANRNLDRAIDAYYYSREVIQDAHAIKRYQTLGNVSVECKNCLDVVFMGVSRECLP